MPWPRPLCLADTTMHRASLERTQLAEQGPQRVNTLLMNTSEPHPALTHGS